MSSILIIGAGRSSSALIRYLLKHSENHSWKIIVADANLLLAQKKVDNHPNGLAVQLDIFDKDERRIFIGQADVVVSMLPAHLHIRVAEDCVKYQKHLITASYVSQEMRDLDRRVKENGLIFMCEMGLDPGIDHMSAMQKLDTIKGQGGRLSAFRSCTGGLVAPESDNNPWHYKFTWNPRNVVLAGQGTAKFLENGTYKYIPYPRLFKQLRMIDVPGMGQYEVYANRDSLTYREIYDLKDIPHILRGTIRCKGFCEAWNAFVQLGLTDDTYVIADSERLTWRQLIKAFLPKTGKGSLEERVADLAGIDPDSEAMRKLRWLGIFEDQPIEMKMATPAQILEALLLKKWKLEPDDKDMIIMQHEFEYVLNGEEHLDTSTLILKGEGGSDTAMARLVGLPMGIITKLVLEGKVASPGVHIPVMKEVYEPVLEELKTLGVKFIEQESVKV